MKIFDFMNRAKFIYKINKFQIFQIRLQLNEVKEELGAVDIKSGYNIL